MTIIIREDGTYQKPSRSVEEQVARQLRSGWGMRPVTGKCLDARPAPGSSGAVKKDKAKK